MAEFSSWAADNWKDVVTVLGSAVGIWIAVAAFNRNREKDVKQEQKTLSKAHERLWSNVRDNPELCRVLLAKVDLKKMPLTTQEELFLNQVFLHFERGWEAAKTNRVLTMEAYLADVRGFFTRPLPHAAWEKMKRTHNPKFVRFIDRAIERIGRFDIVP